jgi:hypothetical protein
MAATSALIESCLIETAVPKLLETAIPTVEAHITNIIDTKLDDIINKKYDGIKSGLDQRITRYVDVGIRDSTAEDGRIIRCVDKFIWESISN